MVPVGLVGRRAQRGGKRHTGLSGGVSYHWRPVYGLRTASLPSTSSLNRERQRRENKGPPLEKSTILRSESISDNGFMR